MRAMREAGFTQAELADAVNARLHALGCDGTVSDRTVRHWLTGKTQWPHSRQREALEAVFNCPITDLGFTPRSTPREDPVLRRDFINASTGAALAAARAPTTAERRVGSGDVQRLLTKFSSVIASDHQYGGRLTIEIQASALAGEALSLQSRGSASQRVRGSLYGCAALFTSSAMWAAIDGRRFDSAQRHFDRASSLAVMSGDQGIQFRIWSHAGSLYRHLGRPTDALAANDVARTLPITRRDPMFASLGHARHAAIHGLTGDIRAVRHTVGLAQDALLRADAALERPVWLTSFYDQAELDNLALAAYLALGGYEDAEAHAHRSLALLRPAMRRTRAITTARLAGAQLGQGDLEPAVFTAMSIPTDSNHPRITGMLDDFGKTLRRTAPSSPLTQTWDQFLHDSRRDPQ